MPELHFPWIETAILLPLIGAGWVAFISNPVTARKHCVVFAFLSFFAATAESQDFYLLHIHAAGDAWHLMTRLIGRELFVIDELSAPLPPLTALLFLLTALTTLRTKLPRFSFVGMLLSESITLALFSATDPAMVILFLTLGTIPPFLELRARGRSTMLYLGSMAISCALLILGWNFVEAEHSPTHTLLAMFPLLIAVSIRCGMFPFQGWISELYENGTFGTALLMTTPMTGAYAALRLVVPIAPDWVLRSLGLISLFTAVYASALSLVQKDARRFFYCMLLSHSAMVLIGLEVVTPLGLTGALCVWLSSGISLGGLGLTLRALEARRGRLELKQFQGLYDHTPALAICFMLTGLGCVGFPGTMGFIGNEMLIDGAVATYPHVGVLLVIASAMNGISIVRAYFLLFTGTRYDSSVSLKIGIRERVTSLTIAILIVGGGILPQPSVASRFHAAIELLKEREAAARSTTPTTRPDTANKSEHATKIEVSSVQEIEKHSPQH